MIFFSRLSVHTIRPIVHTKRLDAPTIGARYLSTPAQAYLEPIKSGISAITLDRPKAKNAISMQLLRELRECIAIAGRDKS